MTHGSLPHHDGSETYVPEQTPKLSGKVTVFLRVPRTSDVTHAWVRVLCEGEPELARATVDRQDTRATWLSAELRVVNPVMSYRWLLDGSEYGYQWLNGTGLHSHDVADAADFRLSTYEKPTHWATGTMYQIFPDRFATSVERPTPAWAKPAAWDDPVIGEGLDTPERWDHRRLAHTRALFQTRADSVALRRGGLRWLSVENDSLTFLREAPGETILVHAARATRPPVKIPATVLGPALTGFAGTPDLHADAHGMLILPAEGPTFGMWRVKES